MNLPLLLANGKRVGEVVGDTAYLPVASANYLAVGEGYSIDDRVLSTIINAGCALIDFWNKKTCRHFRVRVEAFKANAKPFDFGWGRKWAAPMSCYDPQLRAQED